MSQVLYEAKEPLDFVIVPRFSPVADAGHLICVDMKALICHAMAKTVHVRGVKVAFAGLDEQVVVAEDLEDFAKVDFVVFQGS